MTNNTPGATPTRQRWLPRCGGLFMVGFDGSEPPAALLGRIAAGKVGGVILFSRNIRSPAQTAALLAALRRAAPRGRPLLLAVDQEGGRVQRLGAPMALWPPMRTLGKRDDPELSRRVGRAMGADLGLLGFNLDFAPVLDVVQSAKNAVIGDRSFGPDPEKVARHGLALAAGLVEAGVLPCAKHFPGHGGPVSDSHLGLPREERDEAELRRVDLLPFTRAIAAGLPLLMSAHVLYPALDPQYPATLSRRICTELLRDELGFAGALASDDLEMGAITASLAPGEAAVGALAAGVDLLLFCRDEQSQEQALEALVREVERSEALQARLEQAEARLNALRNLLPIPALLDPDRIEQMVQAKRHAELLEKLTGEAAPSP